MWGTRVQHLVVWAFQGYYVPGYTTRYPGTKPRFFVILGYCVPEYTRGYPSTKPGCLGYTRVICTRVYSGIPEYTTWLFGSYLGVTYRVSLQSTYPTELTAKVACSREAMGGNG